MQRFTRIPPRFLLLLAALVLVAGCNVYEGLYEEGTSDDPEVLLEDARIALQQDRPDAAVEHLKKALNQTPAGSLLRKRVQVSLASAVLKQQQIDVLRFSQMVEEFVPSFRASVPAAKTQSQACTFPADHTTEAFDPAAGIDFAQLSNPASSAALQESRALIAHVFSGDETVFPCDDAGIDAAIAGLKAEGMSTPEIASALVSYAVVISSIAYVDVVQAGGDSGQFFYVTPPSGKAYVGLCFPEATICLNTKARVSNNLGALDCATRLLQKRAALLGSTAASELAGLARDGYDSMLTGLGTTQCLVH